VVIQEAAHGLFKQSRKRVVGCLIGGISVNFETGVLLQISDLKKKKSTAFKDPPSKNEFFFKPTGLTVRWGFGICCQGV
jgi:hypothetical protein